jgi:FixJ family two-component response regulator
MTTSASWVIAVDDDPAVRMALQNLLEAAGYRVATMAASSGLIDDPRLHLSCCLLLDLRMPGVSGLDVQRQLEAAGVHVPVVFLSGHGDVSTSVAAMKQGAVDFLEKPVDPSALLAAVRRALDRGDEARAVRHRLATARRRLSTLTPRERSVLDAVMRGCLNKQVASELGLTERTVKFHRGNVMRKMHAASVAQLAALMQQLRSSQPPVTPDGDPVRGDG